jgi:hypothetical protein
MDRGKGILSSLTLVTDGQRYAKSYAGQQFGHCRYRTGGYLRQYDGCHRVAGRNQTVCIMSNEFLHRETSLHQFRPKSILVYHCCTGHLGTLTWGKVAEHGLAHLHYISLEDAIFYPNLQFTENK